MSRTVRGSKGAGYDYGGRRHGNHRYGNSPNRRKAAVTTKQFTARAERRIARQERLDWEE